jgi:hypothetical protein
LAGMLYPPLLPSPRPSHLPSPPGFTAALSGHRRQVAEWDLSTRSTCGNDDFMWLSPNAGTVLGATGELPHLILTDTPPLQLMSPGTPRPPHTCTARGPSIPSGWLIPGPTCWQTCGITCLAGFTVKKGSLSSCFSRSTAGAFMSPSPLLVLHRHLVWLLHLFSVLHQKWLQQST